MSAEFLILPTPVTRMPDVWIILVRLPVFARLGLRMLVANVQVSYSLFQRMWQLFRVVAFWHSTFQYAELLHCTFLRHIYSRTVVDKRPFHMFWLWNPTAVLLYYRLWWQADFVIVGIYMLPRFWSLTEYLPAQIFWPFQKLDCLPPTRRSQGYHLLINMQ